MVLSHVMVISIRCLHLADLSCETAWHANEVSHRAHDHRSLRKTGIESFWYQCVVAIVSAWMAMFQDFARFTAHCRRGAIHNFFWRIDWLCGSSPTFVTYNKQRITIRLVFVLYLGIVFILASCMINGFI